MNYAVVDKVEDLIKWPDFTDQDQWGRYHIITGYEGTGRCFWCGAELEGRRRFCGHRSGHWTLYAKHFYWNYARNWCCERQKGICASCGWKPSRYNEDEPYYYWYKLEVHHIIALNGQQRIWTPYNLPWNLIGFCHKCHQEIHAVIREANKPAPLDIFELALKRGQLAFNTLVER